MAGLRTLSLAYRAAVAARNAAYRGGLIRRRRLPARVISVGNISVGGTGKTPLVAHLVALSYEMGLRPCVLTRGYGRREGGIRLHPGPDRADPGSIGDEPALLAGRFPGLAICVGGDRFRAGSLAMERVSPDVMILDDGFQYLRLHRDCDIVAVDASREIWSKRLIPAGPLREPPGSLRRADLICLTHLEGCRDPGRVTSFIREIAPDAGLAGCRYIPVKFTLRPEGGEMPPEWIRGRRVASLAGIARPELFEDMLLGLGADIAGSFRFPDHHFYSADDIRKVRRFMAEGGAELLVTTEKDAVKLPDGMLRGMKVAVLVIGLKFDFGGELLRWALSGDMKPREGRGEDGT